MMLPVIVFSAVPELFELFNVVDIQVDDRHIGVWIPPDELVQTYPYSRWAAWSRRIEPAAQYSAAMELRFDTKT